MVSMGGNAGGLYGWEDEAPFIMLRMRMAGSVVAYWVTGKVMEMKNPKV